jgi:hypothetical protein
MKYDIEFIKQEWLLQGTIPYSEDQVLAAFNEVQATLGQNYLDRIKFPNGIEIKGPHITMYVVELGLKLQLLRTGINFEPLVVKIKSTIENVRVKAIAELNSIYFLCKDGEVDFELEPTVSRVGRSESHPDFRIKRKGESKWIYIEVKQPDTSDENISVGNIIKRLTNLFDLIENELYVEIMLLGIPSEEELSEIESECVNFLFESNHDYELEMQNLGLIKISTSVNYIVTPTDYPGFKDKPRLSSNKTLIGNNGFSKSITCRIAVSDKRIERFLNSATDQLPSDSSNIIWIDGKNVPSIKEWSNLIKKLFIEKAEQCRKVSGLVTFLDGIGPTHDGISVINIVKLTENENAEQKIPEWVKVKF